MDSPSQIEQKFNAAVNVIRGLPKNGSYQPSNDMMLRFYSFYKQATLGSCKQPKPAFYDVVGRAKYEAYKALGNMPKERAMELYVEELNKIIETMSFTENVAEFMSIMSDQNEVDDDDAKGDDAEGDDAEAIGSSSPQLVLRESRPVVVSKESICTNGVNGRNEHTTVNAYPHNQENGHCSDPHSDDEYIDTVEDDIYSLREPFVQDHTSRATTRRPIENNPQVREITSTSNSTTNNYKQIEPTIQQILRTVENMRSDLHRINSRIDVVERLMADVKNYQLKKKVGVNVDINILNSTTVTKAKYSKLKIMSLRYPRWWPFCDISPIWFFVLILWPFMARQMARMLQRKRN
ncbi:Acyl-CoA-binding domain-containing protein 5 [Pseudolycoriella hygida]|uniref:Acyl-CoA-binding domain-containing protein 5 n=1 Tax=Pseudolycoriella hygida TaxID=35572 RepID=A0A9Q0N0Q2_9DIPT|nr:Acyl-CoA-binding domain-containing protein 5 [Pseudolycoriella hygida]